MPELPDLQIIRECLAPRLTNVAIASVEVRRPLVVRNLLGRRFVSIGRRGKVLLLELAGDVTLVINPMLAGRIRYGEPLPRQRIATHCCRACQPGLMVNRR